MTDHLKTHPIHTAIVTGATSGIGLDLIRQLCEAGWHVIAIGRNQTMLDGLQREHASIEAIAFDLSRIERIHHLVDQIMSRRNRVDLLINNAAIQNDATFGADGTGPFDSAHEIAINLTAPICLCSELLPFMLDQGAGAIVNVSSGLALVPKRTAAVYCASKAGLSHFSEALRAQPALKTVSIVDVILPLVDTPMTTGRGSGKISSRAAAEATIAAASGPSRRVFVGKARALPSLIRWLPWVARAVLQRG